ncbi:MAG: chemotaxis protein CheW [Rhodocyclales bacterium]|nr:chemotaxis protein CheW [Rhodocyclales bacterium]
MAQRTSLRAFQERLAERLREASANPGQHWLVLRAGGRRLLLPLTDAAAIANEFTLPPVPRAPACYRGLANVRGNLVGVVDLGWLESRTPTSLGKHALLLVLSGRIIDHTGLLLEETVGLRPMSAFTPIETMPGIHPWHACAYHGADDPEPSFLIDTTRLVADPRFFGLTPARQAATTT